MKKVLTLTLLAISPFFVCGQQWTPWPGDAKIDLTSWQSAASDYGGGNQCVTVSVKFKGKPGNPNYTCYLYVAADVEWPTDDDLYMVDWKTKQTGYPDVQGYGWATATLTGYSVIPGQPYQTWRKMPPATEGWWVMVRCSGLGFGEPPPGENWEDSGLEWIPKPPVSGGQ